MKVSVFLSSVTKPFRNMTSIFVSTLSRTSSLATVKKPLSLRGPPPDSSAVQTLFIFPWTILQIFLIRSKFLRSMENFTFLSITFSDLDMTDTLGSLSAQSFVNLSDPFINVYTNVIFTHVVFFNHVVRFSVILVLYRRRQNAG